MVKTTTTRNIMPGDKRKRDESDIDSEMDSEVDGSSSYDEDGVSSGEEEEEEEEENQKVLKNKAKISAQQVQEARDTAALYHSNIVKMQIDELLKEVEVKDTKVKGIEKILFKIRDIILATPSRNQVTIKEALKSFDNCKVTIPFPDPKPVDEAQYRFSFISPTDITLCGTFALKTMIRDPDGLVIDVAVTMPKECFQDKDYVNYRYFHKRAYYIACLAQHIESQVQQATTTVEYGYMDGDRLKPVILVGVSNPECTIRITTVADKSVFALRKLEPTRNCVRLKSSHTLDSLSFPTTNYNNSILLDLSLVDLTGYVLQSAKSCPAFRDACKLASVWLKQREFSSSCGGFGDWEFALVMAVLLHGDSKSKSSSSRILLDGFSSFQLFKTTIHFLSSRDLVKQPFFFNKGNDVQLPDNNSIPQIVDRITNVNILGKMSCSAYRYLVHEASNANNYLDDTKNDYFDALFLEKVSQQQYQADLIFTIPISNGKSDKSYTQYEQVEYPDYTSYLLSRLYSVLSKALSDRLVAISFSGPFTEASSFSLNKRVAKSSDQYHHSVVVGIVLDPANAAKSVILGPHASDDPDKGQEFRTFWGERAELRRFKDSSIRESVVWNNNGDIPRQIVEYILNLHFHPTQLNFSFKGVDKVLPTCQENPASTPIAPFSPVMNAFTTLTKQLESLKDVPLIMKIVVGASSTLRYASAFIPEPFSLHGESTFNNIVIEFEASSRWPDDLQAIQETKAAFLIKISQQLKEQYPENKTSLGKDLQLSNTANKLQQPFLDVFVPQGFAFRIRILYEREEQLFKRLIETAPNPFIRENVSRDYLEYCRLFTGAVSHTRAIQTLMYRYQYLSPTVRLLKRWFQSHYLGILIPDELIELIAANVFIKPAPWTVPASGISGFLRCLHFLSEWDWRSDPLIVDLDSDGNMDIEIKSDAHSAFQHLRKQDPHLDHVALFVGSKLDTSGSLWSRGISKVIGARITSLARACVRFLLNQVPGTDIDKFFRSPTKDYDFVLELDPKNSGGGGSKKNHNGKVEKVLDWSPKPVLESSIDYNCLLYKQLDLIYRDVVVLFTNGVNIAGIWNPLKFKPDPRPFKVNCGYSTAPSDDDNQVVPNKQAMVLEMYRLSDELIKQA